MRTAFLTAISALIFTAFAQAGAFQAGDDIVSVTLTGTVTSGNDIVDLFGGGSLTGDAALLSISYDATYLDSVGNYSTDGTGYSENYIFNDSSAYRISVTIGAAAPYSVTPNSDALNKICDSNECTPGYVLSYGVDDLGNFIQLITDNSNDSSLGFDVNSQANILAQITDQSATNTLYVGNNFTDRYDVITLSPEPSTWLSMALSFGGVALLRLRRSRG